MDKNAKDYPLDKVLMCAACEIAVHGYVSYEDVQRQGGDTTKYWVQQLLSGSELGIGHQKALLEIAGGKGLDLFGATFKVAVFDVIQWARKLNPAESDYTATIYAIAHRTPSTVTHREFGQVASMLMTYQRQLAKRKQVYVGTVGDEIALDVKIVNIKAGASGHGEWWLVKAKTPKDTLINWFTNKEPPFRENDELVISGHVKDHSEFHGDKWTKLNRVKVVKGYGSKV